MGRWTTANAPFPKKILATTRLFQRRPGFLEHCLDNARFHCFIGWQDDDISDMEHMARTCGGVFVLRDQPIPDNIVEIVMEVVEDNQTFLVMTWTRQDRETIKRLVFAEMDARRRASAARRATQAAE